MRSGAGTVAVAEQDRRAGISADRRSLDWRETGAVGGHGRQPSEVERALLYVGRSRHGTPRPVRDWDLRADGLAPLLQTGMPGAGVLCPLGRVISLDLISISPPWRV